MDKNKAIPSMFHRRLVLILVVFAMFFIVLAGQMVRLSVVEGAERLAVAEAQLDSRTFLPTTRGRILDRQSRVLAIDRASSDIAVEYSVITGTWSLDKARRLAITDMGRSKWNAIGPDERQAAQRAYIPQCEALRQRLWNEICRLGKIAPDELQKRLDEIKGSVQSAAASTWERQRTQEQLEYGITEDEFKPQPIVEQREPHVVLTAVSDEVAFEFRKLDEDMPGMIDVQDSRRREYPWLNAEVRLSRSSLPKPLRSDKPATIQVIGVADHILGSVRNDVWAQDVQRRPFIDPKTGEIDLGGYRSHDMVGSRGIEAAYEDVLRGLRGEVLERRDNGSQNRTEPQPGKDLRLTLDIALQARVQAILTPEFGLAKVQPWQHNTRLSDGQPLNAAAVVLEIQSGEVLAMVSMPTMAMGDLMSDRQKQINFPSVNRAAEAVYPPGSIIKPLVLCAAVSEGVHDLDATITCSGHFFSDLKDRARCWIYREQYGMRTHGPLKAEEALARSCNIFFYTLGDRLGIKRLANWFRRFGLGERLNCGLVYESFDKDGNPRLVGEHTGEVPDAADIEKFKATDLKFRQISMGIGQGPVTWTPLQAANAYATIARGGVIRDASIVLNDPHGPRAKRCDDLHFKPRLIAATLEGLRESVMERFGTGYHITYDDHTDDPIINAQGVQVWAKTGTAQAPAWRIADTNDDGEINTKDQGILELDHSWFVGLVGPKDANKPMHAIAVVVEYGGSGGRTAGPIANQIIHALQAEGYLPGDSDASSVATSSYSGNEPEPEREDDH